MDYISIFIIETDTANQQGSVASGREESMIIQKFLELTKMDAT